MEKKRFDYQEAVKELEEICTKVEDPSVGIDDVDRYIKRSSELIEACRDYLRGARESLQTDR